MKGIDRLKQKFEHFYSSYGNYLNALTRFLAALVLFLQINGRLGYMAAANNVFLVLILALFCSFLPVNAIVLLASGLIFLHLYALSVPALAAGGGILLIVLLLYFSFAGNQAWEFVLTYIALGLHIPCAVPLAFGLLGNPLSGVGIAAGTIVYYTLAAVQGIQSSKVTLAMAEKAGSETFLDEIKACLDAVLQEQELMLMLLALLTVLLVVYFTRRMAMKYAWTVAIFAGTLIYLVLAATGSLMLETRTGVVWLAAGAVISLLFALVLEVLFFHLDYKRTEKLQFEDDDYYYYVQAVPKKHSAGGERRKMDRKGRGVDDGDEIIYP